MYISSLINLNNNILDVTAFYMFCLEQSLENKLKRQYKNNYVTSIEMAITLKNVAA